MNIAQHRFTGEIKRWAAHQIPRLVQGSAIAPDRLLIADYLNVNAAKRLREEGIQFIDTAGNAYIDRPGLKILIRGNSRPAALSRDEDGQPIERAFQRKGLIVVYHLLTTPQLVAAPLRTIAMESGVSHGTANNVIKALEAGSFVANGRGGQRLILDKRKLMERWVAGYGETLAPKLLIGAFYSESIDWWGKADVEQFSAAWSGETAGAFYTDYLTPQVATIFLPRTNLAALMQRHRLRKPPPEIAINLRVMERFWGAEEERAAMVHPLLAYADLIYSGDARNAQVARILDERYLTEYFGAD